MGHQVRIPNPRIQAGASPLLSRRKQAAEQQSSRAAAASGMTMICFVGPCEAKGLLVGRRVPLWMGCGWDGMWMDG